MEAKRFQIQKQKLEKIKNKIGVAYTHYIPLEAVDEDYALTIENEEDMEVYMLTGIKFSDIKTIAEEEQPNDGTEQYHNRYGYEQPFSRRYYN